MEWTDTGVVLALRRHGESDAIASILTAEHGRHAGLVRGGGRRQAPVFQLGNRITLRWRGRLEEHLGSFVGELEHATAARLLDEPERLSGLAAACAVTEAALPEREPHPGAHGDLLRLVAALQDDADWRGAYVRWECRLLAELGFGLDLARCAATGVSDELVFVSPRTGRAVSRGAGQPYADRLFALPAFLAPVVGSDPAGPPAAPPAPHEIEAGLALTGYFLDREVFQPLGRAAGPGARTRFVDQVRRWATMSGSGAL